MTRIDIFAYKMSSFDTDLFIQEVKEELMKKIGPYAFTIILREGVEFLRDELVNFLDKRDIDTRGLFSSMPTQCRGFSFLGHKLGDFLNSEYIGKDGVHLGVSQDLTRSRLDYVIETIDKFLVKKRTH